MKHPRDREKKDGIIIVSGLPRSGTSLMMQMLEAGGLPPLTDQVRTADSDNPKGYYEFEAVKKTKQDASWLDLAVGKVVKMIHLLLYDLPPERSYSIIFMKRDLKEVIASQGAMLRRLKRSGASLSDSQLMAAYQEQLLEVEKWLKERSNFSVLMVNYNELLREPARVAGKVNEFLGGRLDSDAMQNVIDPALYRQRC